MICFGSLNARWRAVSKDEGMLLHTLTGDLSAGLQSPHVSQTRPRPNLTSDIHAFAGSPRCVQSFILSFLVSFINQQPREPLVGGRVNDCDRDCILRD
ncbi:hypothetical protein Mapa_010492 [Marchantia paleacea]|nr:hypothetical protein Mapa_010492 [Marchantia paleacea]